VSWEGVIPNQGPYGAFFSYDVGRDLGTSELSSFLKTTGIGRATSSGEWQLSGSFGATPGTQNPGQSLVCDAAGTCGDGNLDAGEDCDDGNTADGDCCSSICGFESLGSSCEDGDACTDGDVCDGGGACTPGGPLACDDGQFCNGVETCDSGSGCQAGTPVSPDDGVACTLDSCDEVADVVVNTPDDGFCSDGQLCNGAETCDALADCQSGTPVDVDDGVVCTIDECHDPGGVVTHTANDAFCDDGLICNGTELCDLAFDCQAGTPVDVDDGVDCTVDTCQEGTGFPVNTPDDDACIDGPSCTAGSCDAIDGCVYTPIPGCAPVVPIVPIWASGLIGSMLAAAGAIWLRDRRRD
jgi:cysteine-rich repeat protein